MQLRHALLGIFLLALLFAYFGVLNLYELFGEEPRRAVVAIEMIQSGNWLVPQLNGIPYYNKPPLFNWLLASSFKLFNSFDPWVVRLPGLLSFFAMAGVHFWVTRKYVNAPTALYATLFLLVAAEILYFGGVVAGEIDLFYSLLVYVQAVLIYVGFTEKKWWLLFVGSYLFMALGILTKGLPSLVFQGLTLLALAISKKQFRWLFTWQHLSGIGLTVLLIGSYFYAYNQQEDAAGYMINLIKEATQKSAAESNVGGILWNALTSPLEFLKFLLPASLFVGSLFTKRFKDAFRSNALLRYFLLFVIVNIPLYLFTSYLRARYMYVFFPMLITLLTTAYLAHIPNHKKWEQMMRWGLLGMMVLIGLAAIALPFAPYTKEVVGIHAIGFILFIASIVLILLYRKFPQHLIILFLIAIAFTRITLNYTYIPLRNAEQIATAAYQKHVTTLLQISEQRPIYLTGTLHHLPSTITIGGIEVLHANLSTAWIHAYQLDYFHFLHTQERMRFVPLDEMRPGEFYLAIKGTRFKKPIEEHYTFKDDFVLKQLVLVSLKEP